jgi:hypothetical protein
MEHGIKALAEAITHTHTKNLIQSHVKELHFENNHLIIFVDNAAPLHEFETKEIDHHLQKGIGKLYEEEGEDITYELRIHGGEIPHEREKLVPHDIHQ